MDDLLIRLPQVSSKISSAREIIYEMLKENILLSVIPAGTHLNERKIAQQTNVSTTPIKEALRRLETEGLVVTVPRKGTYVSSQIMKSLEEITFVRSALEGVAVRFAAQKATDEEIANLSVLIEQMREATDRKSYEVLIELNEVFHRSIRLAAKNDFLVQQIDSVRAYDMVIRKKALIYDDELPRALKEHQEIYLKVASHDGDGAEEAMIRHIRRTLSFVKSEQEHKTE